jgi:lipopolysaccharide export system permease protein
MLRLSLPVFVAAFGLAVAVFLLSEIVMPYASSRSQAIWYKAVKKRDPTRFYGRNHIWYKGPESIYWIKHFDDRRYIMQSPTFYFFDDDFALVMKVRGRQAVWTGENWRVLQGSVQTADFRGDYRYRQFRKLDLELAEGPEAFLKTVKRPEEMGYWELKRYAENIRREGYDAAPYFVDMHIKLAFPLVSFVMVLMGVPIALLRKQGGVPLSVSIGISVCFLYLLTLGVTRSFGLSGALPAVLAAWFANALFFLIGIYLLMRTDT